MKLILWYIERINESNSVKLTLNKHPESWKIEICATWDNGFQSSECFNSLDETKAYLRGFYDAFPF